MLLLLRVCHMSSLAWLMSVVMVVAAFLISAAALVFAIASLHDLGGGPYVVVEAW